MTEVVEAESQDSEENSEVEEQGGSQVEGVEVKPKSGEESPANQQRDEG